MLSFALSLVMAAGLSAGGWEPVTDPDLGVELLRPAGWSVEALANDAIVVRAPPPLGGQVTVIPVRGAGLTGRALVAEVAKGLGAKLVRELEMSTGHAALVQFTDPAAPAVERTAEIVAALQGDRAIVSILSAPAAEFEAARPALTAIAQYLKLTPPPAKSAPIARRPLVFEPFLEPKEQAFTGELPGDWKKDLSVAIIQGEAPYVRASVIGRSSDHLFAFAHYKLASFQEPVEGLTTEAKSILPYQSGALALENYLFPKVVEKAPGEFGDWKITRRGGAKALFTHESGVRFDGEEVEYEYRFRGELLQGHAFAVTYLLPSKPSPVWYLYGLFGWEAPQGRGEEAREAALQLLRTFNFEGRYAQQADMFWTLARDGALQALAPTQPAPAADEEPKGGVIPRIAADASLGSVERFAASFTSVGTGEKAASVKVGVAQVAIEGAPLPTAAFQELKQLH